MYTFRQKLAFSLLGLDENQKEIIAAICNGQTYVPDSLHEHFSKYYEARRKFFESNTCTEREIEIGKICVLAEKGFSQKKIAAELGLTPTQVNTRCKKYGIVTIGMKI